MRNIVNLCISERTNLSTWCVRGCWNHCISELAGKDTSRQFLANSGTLEWFLSNSFSVSNGVNQGTVIRPVQFCAYCANLRLVCGRRAYVTSLEVGFVVRWHTQMTLRCLPRLLGPCVACCQCVAVLRQDLTQRSQNVCLLIHGERRIAHHSEVLILRSAAMTSSL